MTQFDEQIERIKSKLIEARRVDNQLKVFGASSHKYQHNSPPSESEVSDFETRYSIELPDSYKAFILNIGNGGKSFCDSAAGPYYGIYPIGNNIEELVRSEYLNWPCKIYPEMSDDFWKTMINNTEENDHLTDAAYEKERGKVFGGILPIGSQGCTYIHGLVLNGPYEGKVVNLDLDEQKPKFTFESNFLDWYERWLDEVISGDLIVDKPAWFGYTMGGSADVLITAYQASPEMKAKEDCLVGILNKKNLDESTLKFIESELTKSSGLKRQLLQILTKFSYDKAKPYLIEMTKSDLLSVFQFVYWYATRRSPEWIIVIESSVDRIDDSETFRFCTYLLAASHSDYGNLIVKFTTRPDEEIRTTAFYTLGQLQNKEKYFESFTNGLLDKSTKVVRTTLQALNNIKDKRLLKYYKQIAERFSSEETILSNLNYRLADYGLTHSTIQEIDPDRYQEKALKKKQWFQFWS